MLKFGRIVKWLLQGLFRYFSKLTRLRNNEIWVFGSRHGRHYDENSKHLFQFVNREAKNIRAIWLTKEKKIKNHLIKKGYEVYNTHSLSGIYYSLKAGVAIISVCYEDVNSYAISGAKVVQLWHGTPLKKTDIFGTNKKYEMVTVAAEEFLYNKVLGDHTKSNFVLTGYPRNDILYSNIRNKFIDNIKKRQAIGKVVLYLPTYRDKMLDGNKTTPHEKFDLFEKNDFNPKRLLEILKKYDAYLIIKLHPAQKSCIGSGLKNITRKGHAQLIDSGNPLIDIYEYLKYVDVLITDYSSVYFDYLLLNRPIIFTPFDIEEYKNTRNFGLDYNAVTPGPKAYNWQEVCSQLDAVLNGRDDWGQQRREICARFNAYQDGNSSLRVYEEIRRFEG